MYKYKVDGKEFHFDSNVNQDIKGDFVSKHLYGCVTSTVEYIIRTTYDSVENFENAPFNYEDIDNQYIDNDDEIEELQEELEELETEREECEEYLDDIENEYENDPAHSELVEEIASYRSKVECLNEKIEELEEEINDLEILNGDLQEVYEWWHVDSYLCSYLKERGEVVIDHMNYWGRQSTGQAILLDSIISEICYDLQILEGQKYSWEKYK